ncbi:MAG: farnesyl-diphosphate synthase [Thiotrichales bacterium]|nr:farnesyl-diphosphate synthase [Thiotrichales bacterium]|tara:strand:- start:3417 stop:4304 length:888 start_codon:yes stop_codon:yes gene_type:complete
MKQFEQALDSAVDSVNAELEKLLPAVEGPEQRLLSAMRYSTLAGGKRLRAFLVLSSADLFEVSQSCALRVAAAVELVHTYSLVHDDLPAMDDDDMRRGQPTAHVAYDEATAILAGDALLTLAFEVLADEATHSRPSVRCELIRSLAVAAGCRGMVAGQMIDLDFEHAEADVSMITRLQQLKTGALIAFACESGTILGQAHSTLRHALHAYAHDLGLAFQIIDDLLDAQGSEEELGKAAGKDEEAGKATFVSLLGIERAQTQARMLADQASAHLEPFGDRVGVLRDAAKFVIERRS